MISAGDFENASPAYPSNEMREAMKPRASRPIVGMVTDRVGSRA